jgi:cell division protein FtsA
MVLTGGTSALPGIRTLANKVLNLPVRIAQPQNLVGMVDRLNSPAFSTSVGLLKWALLMSEITPAQGRRRGGSRQQKPSENTNWEKLKEFLRRLLP